MKTFPAWAAPAASAAALAVFAVAFAAELESYRKSVVEWAERDLKARVELAAANLRSPVETSDFRRIHELGAEFASQGLRLGISTPEGGVFFDSAPPGARAGESLTERAECAGHSVSLSLPLDAVLAPYAEARRGFALAGAAGAVSVFLVFFFSFRQIVRMKELARLEKFRRDFTADVSHEIKTPLTGILGAADLLEDATDETRGRLVGMIVRESKRLNALAQGILDLARLERAPSAPDMEEADIAGIAREAVESLSAEASAKGVRLRFRVRDGSAGRTRAVCSRDLVFRAVANLVANAVRHSGAESVEIEASGSGRFVEVSVVDSGKGVPPEAAGRIFERFYRADASRSAESGGAGLGLAIVESIAKMHGGFARYAPAKPAGSVFTVAFRRA